MTRQAFAVALLALLAAAPLIARPTTSKAVYTCGTDPKRPERTEGRLDTWNLSTLGFMPDVRGLKPLLIKYKSITRIEFGRSPGRRADLLLDRPCSVRRADHYVTIFYKKEMSTGDKKDPDDPDAKDATQSKDVTESKDSKPSKDDRESKQPRQSQHSKDRQQRLDRRDPKTPIDRKEQRIQEEQEKEKQKDMDRERIAVFELGEGVLRPTLRILETRSGRRVTYQDIEARKAAR